MREVIRQRSQATGMHGGWVTALEASANLHLRVEHVYALDGPTQLEGWELNAVIDLTAALQTYRQNKA